MSKKRLVVLMGVLIFLIISNIIFYCPAAIFTKSELISFIGVILLGTVALFQEQFKSWYRSPDLKIDFRLEAPHCLKTPYHIEWNELSKRYTVSTEAYYFKVEVINLGESQARFCEVFISDLQEYKDNKWQKNEYFHQVKLKWDGEKSQETYAHINPSPIRFLCLIGHIIKESEGLAEEHTKRFYLDCLYFIGGYHPTYLSPNKKYRFKIAVVSENAKYVSETFELYWTGVWKDDSSDMFKEITIKSVIEDNT